MKGQINRALTWIKRSLETTTVANVPRLILPDVHATLDTFGWERLPEVQVLAATNPAAAGVNSVAVPDHVFRYILSASVETNDTGINHIVWMTKAILNGARCGLPLDRGVVVPGEPASLIGRTYLLKGDFLFGESDVATQAGKNMLLNICFIDFPFAGEYIAPF